MAFCCPLPATSATAPSPVIPSSSLCQPLPASAPAPAARRREARLTRPAWLRPALAIRWMPASASKRWNWPKKMGVTIVSEMWAEDDRADFSSDPSFDIDLSVLRRRAAEIQEKEANGEELDSYPKEEEEEDPLLGLSKVFVLLVHSGTDNEGIYSLKVMPSRRPVRAGADAAQMGEHDIILAFEAEEEALRYATLLEAQDFPTPNVEAFAPEEIRDFCEESGHRMGVVPPGSLFMPPEESAIDPAWKTGRAPEEGDKRRSERAAAQQAELDDARLRLEKLLGFGDGEGSTPPPPSA